MNDMSWQDKNAIMCFSESQTDHVLNHSSLHVIDKPIVAGELHLNELFNYKIPALSKSNLQMFSQEEMFHYGSSTRKEISWRSDTESPDAKLCSPYTFPSSHSSLTSSLLSSLSMSVSNLTALSNSTSDATTRSSSSSPPILYVSHSSSSSSSSFMSFPNSTTTTTTTTATISTTTASCSPYSFPSTTNASVNTNISTTRTTTATITTSPISYFPDSSSSTTNTNVTTNSTPAANRSMLPQCRVCQDKSSGFHYGVYTCEACKGFYRRSLCRKNSYKCVGNAGCNITSGRRTLCASCRYSKCLEVGMSRSGIKTGRYTHERRSQNIIEVKMLEKSRNGSIGGSYVRSSSCDAEEEEMQAIFNTINVAQQRLHENLDMFMDDDAVRAKQELYYEEYMAKHQAVQKNCDQDHPTYGDQDTVAFELPANMTRGIQGLVAFCKMIPGFNSLSLHDQASLIKYGRIDVWILGHFKCVNRKLQVLTSMCSFHFDELKDVWNKELCDDLAACCESLMPLNLDKEEIGLLRAICLTSTDQAELKERVKVEEINSTLVTCYRFYCIRRFGNFEKRFGKIISRLIRVREISEKIRCQTAKLSVDFPQIRQNPTLLEAFNN